MNSVPAGSLDPLLLERARKVRLLALDVDGVLTDGRLYFDQADNELKTFCTRDGFGIKALQHFGIGVALITGRSSAIVEKRAQELGIRWVYQGAQNKLESLNDVMIKAGLLEEQVCYAGDDWPDLPVLDRVGLAVTVADADPVVKARVHWVTGRAGGRGAVREICDLILVSQALDQTLLQEILGS